jgi:hypothetical protein
MLKMLKFLFKVAMGLVSAAAALIGFIQYKHYKVVKHDWPEATKYF